jgi:hypothetical protein
MYGDMHTTKLILQGRKQFLILAIFQVFPSYSYTNINTVPIWKLAAVEILYL